MKLGNQITLMPKPNHTINLLIIIETLFLCELSLFPKLHILLTQLIIYQCGKPLMHLEFIL